MKKHVGILIFLITTILAIPAFADNNFTACESTYALCTTATCTPMAGDPNNVRCQCSVKTGYSAGTKSCQQVQDTKQGKLIYSRYFPIKSYVKCSNNRPWAWCLDKPCLVDKNNPSVAYCKCSLAKDLGDYIIVTDKYTNNICTTGIISSATVEQVNQMRNFLKTQKELQPYPIKVINP